MAAASGMTMTQSVEGDKPQPTSVLVLGLEGVGKTALTRHLAAMCESDDTRWQACQLMPTTGFEVTHISFRDRRYALRELGSSMATMWPAYVTRTDVLILVVDASARSDLAVAWVELLHVLHETNRSGDARSAPLALCIFVNKCDLVRDPDQAEEEVANLMQLEEDLSDTFSNCGVLKGSALDQESSASLLDWLAAT